MIHSVRFTCVLDTNVLYPGDVRDLLFWFASYDLFTPKWSRHIFDEWADVMRRKGIPEIEIGKRTEKAQRLDKSLTSTYLTDEKNIQY